MSNKPFEIQVIPKGFDRQGRFFVTLCVVPDPAQLEKNPVNLPQALAGSGRLKLSIGGSKVFDGPLPQANVQLLDEKLWDRLFTCTEKVAQRSPPTGSWAMQFRSAESAGHLLGFMGEAARQSRTLRALGAQGSAPLRMPVMAGVSMGRDQKRTVRAGSLQSELESVRELFNRPGPSTSSLVDRIKSVGRAKKLDEELKPLQGLLAAYAEQQPAIGTPGSAADPLAALGLRDAAMDLMRERMALMLGQQDVYDRIKASRAEVDRAPYGNVVTAWIDSMLATAPHQPRNRGALMAQPQSGSAHDAADLASLPNRLAAVGQEFALHPFLGLSIDLRLALPAGAVRAGTIVASLSGLDAQCRPTVMTADGQVAPRPSDAANGIAAPLRPGSRGRFLASGALLHNVDLHPSLTKVVGSLQQTVAETDPLTRGAGAAALPSNTATLRTGPLVACASDFALEKVQTHARDTNPGAVAHDVSQPLYLDDLAIGMRPDLSLSPEAGAQEEWLPLLARAIHYNQLDAQRVESAKALVDETRQEGYFPLARFELPGQQDVGEPLAAFSEQLFEWTGWNPAVPMPGCEQHDNADMLLSKTVQELPTNPQLRYGHYARASLRTVLRDGSSLPAPRINYKLCAPAPAPQAEEIISCGLGVGNQVLPHYRLQRFEPLRAPVALMSPEAAASPLGALETATRVTLASAWHGGTIEHRRSTRFLVPGEIHDILELDRHGAFDQGATPRDTALAEYERTDKGGFATVRVPCHADPQPVLRRLGRGAGPSARARYYPDPLVRSLRLVLVRRDAQGFIRPVTYRGQTCEFVHKLYPQGRSWPQALPLRVDFVAVAHDALSAPLRRLPTVHHEPCVEVGVPYGENFQLLVLPQGEAGELERMHALAAHAPDDSALVAEALTVHVSHLLNAPYPPALRRLDAKPRALGQRTAPAVCTVEVDAGTTQLLELVADWAEPSDNPDAGPPRLLDYGEPPRQAQMVAAVLSTGVRTAIDASLALPGGNQVPRPAVCAPVNAGDAPPGSEPLLPCTHEFADTRHRVVSYHLRAAGSSALATASGWPPPRADAAVHQSQQAAEPPCPIPPDAFAPGFSESAQVVRIAWPATTAPQPIVVREATPSLRFDRSTELLVSRSTREVAITIYMERGWDQSSGPGELAAIVCSGTVASQWGTDPTRLTGVIGQHLLRPQDFAPSAQSRELAALPQLAATRARALGLVLYRPAFDAEQDAWKIDVVVRTPADVAQPFVRLALARFQPQALEPVMLSAPVPVDYVQLPSQRSVTVLGAWRGDPSAVRVVLSGPVGEGSDQGGRPRITAELLVGEESGRGAGVWQDAGLEPVELQPQDGPERGALQWAAVLNVPPRLRRRRVGVRLAEHTLYIRDPFQPRPTLEPGPLQYVEIIELRLVDDSRSGGA